MNNIFFSMDEMMTWLISITDDYPGVVFANTANRRVEAFTTYTSHGCTIDLNNPKDLKLCKWYTVYKDSEGSSQVFYKDFPEEKIDEMITVMFEDK